MPIFSLHETLLPGRILSVTMDIDGKSWRILNIHNFKMPPTIIARMATQADDADTTTIWAGDWNFPPDGSPTLRLGRSRTTMASRDNCECRRWRPLLRRVTEIVHNRSTRFAWRCDMAGPHPSARSPHGSFATRCTLSQRRAGWAAYLVV